MSTNTENTYVLTPDGAYCPGIGVVESFQIVLTCDSGGSYTSDVFTLTGVRSSDLNNDDDPTLRPTTSPGPSPAPSPVPTVSCVGGEYLSSSGTCEACPEGSFANRTAPPWVCSRCSNGFYQPVAGSEACKVCPVGTLASSDRRFCTSCQPGEFVFNKTTCVACPVATFAAVPLNDACNPCGEGSYTGALSGATACTLCEAGRASPANRFSCSVAEEGYYLNPDGSGDVLACPDHMKCAGGRSMPWPQLGYWVDREHLGYAAMAYRCSRDTCKGATNSSCWAIEAYTNASSYVDCDADALQCTDGSAGPM